MGSVPRKLAVERVPGGIEDAPRADGDVVRRWEAGGRAAPPSADLARAASTTRLTDSSEPSMADARVNW